MERIAEASPRFKSRMAGFLYLLILVGALFAPFAVAPSGMMRGDAALPTTAQIRGSKPLYVFGGAAQLVVGACDIGVALIFHGLLKPVSTGLALLAAVFRLVFVAIANANVLNHFAPLLLLSGAEYLSAFKPDQLQTLALVFVRLRTIGFDIALVFFGFHCVVLGYSFQVDLLPAYSGPAVGDWGDRLYVQHFRERYSTCDWRSSLSLHNAASGDCRNRTDPLAHYRRRERFEMEGAGQRCTVECRK